MWSSAKGGLCAEITRAPTSRLSLAFTSTTSRERRARLTLFLAMPSWLSLPALSLSTALTADAAVIRTTTAVFVQSCHDKQWQPPTSPDRSTRDLMACSDLTEAEISQRLALQGPGAEKLEICRAPAKPLTSCHMVKKPNFKLQW